jgi:hypothetical protein
MVLIAVLAPMSAPVSAADRDLAGRKAGKVHRVAPQPFPLSRRARDIRLADACWHACQVDLGRAFQACLRDRRLTDCIGGNDAGDRYCLRNCRVSGGPWLNLAD